MSYATIDDFRQRLPLLPEDPSMDDQVQLVLDQATAIVDGYVEHAWNNLVTTTRVVVGTGGSIIYPLDHRIGSITGITAGSGFTVPAWQELPDGRLEATDAWTSGGWLEGVPYTISADWGYSAPPADIVWATLEIALDIWREREQPSTSGPALKPLVLSVLDRWRSLYLRAYPFIGTIRVGIRHRGDFVPSNYD